MPKPYHTPKSERDAAATDDAIAAGLDEVAGWDDPLIATVLDLLREELGDMRLCAAGPMVQIQAIDDRDSRWEGREAVAWVDGWGDGAQVRYGDRYRPAELLTLARIEVAIDRSETIHARHLQVALWGRP